MALNDSHAQQSTLVMLQKSAEAHGKTAAEMFKEHRSRLGKTAAEMLGVKGLVELPCGTIIYFTGASLGGFTFMGPAMNEASLSITASALPAYICTSDVS